MFAALQTLHATINKYKILKITYRGGTVRVGATILVISGHVGSLTVMYMYLTWDHDFLFLNMKYKGGHAVHYF